MLAVPLSGVNLNRDKFLRWMLTGGLLLACLHLGSGLLFSSNGYWSLWKEQQLSASKKANIISLVEEKKAMLVQLDHLRNDAATKEYWIRRELGYVYPGEKVVLMGFLSSSEQTQQ